MNSRIFTAAAFGFLIMAGCQPRPASETGQSTAAAHLPYLGEHDVVFKTNERGERVPDTLYYTIPKFSFINQDSVEFTHENYAGSVYVTDFFFTTCPSICPVMSAQMGRLQELLRKENLLGQVKLLSHTVNPLYDTPSVLKAYGLNVGADFEYWNFVTGAPEDIYYQAQQGYFLTAFPSDTAAGGFFHTDKFTLVDGLRHIRGYYDGTSTRSVDKLLEDIKILVKER